MTDRTPGPAFGVGWRAGWREWLGTRPQIVECLELTAEHFLARPEDAARTVGDWPCSIHCLGLSVGSREPPDEGYLEALAALCNAVRPRWVSDHLSFTRAAGVDLGHMNPLFYDESTLARIGDRCEAISARLSVPMLLENIASHLQVNAPLAEPAFLAALHARSGVGTLLDVANLHVNACNHGFDADAWLERLDAASVRQMHVVGYGRRGNEWIDDHAHAPQPEIMALLTTALAKVRPAQVVLEWDRGLPSSAIVEALLGRMRARPC